LCCGSARLHEGYTGEIADWRRRGDVALRCRCLWLAHLDRAAVVALRRRRLWLAHLHRPAVGTLRPLRLAIALRAIARLARPSMAVAGSRLLRPRLMLRPAGGA
jgi:hypothetical protein